MYKLHPDCNKTGFSGALCLPSKAGATGFVWVGMWEEQLHNRSAVTCGLQHCWGLGLWVCAGQEQPLHARLRPASFSRAGRDWHGGAELSTAPWASLFALGLEKVNLARSQAPCRNMCSPFLCSWNMLKNVLQVFTSFGQELCKIYWSPFYIYQ